MRLDLSYWRYKRCPTHIYNRRCARCPPGYKNKHPFKAKGKKIKGQKCTCIFDFEKQTKKQCREKHKQFQLKYPSVKK